MSEFRIDQIKNQSGTAGPNIAGISTFNSTSGLLMPSGDTRYRYSGDDGPIVTDGLVLYLDAGRKESFGGDGTIWRDLSGQGNNGTLLGSVGYDYELGGSLVFDSGSNTYVQTPFNSLLTSITLSVWFNAQVQDSDAGSIIRPILLLGDFSTQGPLEISMFRGGVADVGKMRFEIGSDSSPYQYGTTNRYDDQKWYNAVLIKDNKTMRVYINGNLIVEKINDDDDLYDTSRGLSIGGATVSTARRFLGKISVATVHSKALTASEVLQNYNALKGRYGL